MSEVITTPDRTQFLETFRASRLVSDGTFEKAVAKLPAETDAAGAATALVHSGVLTRFQADRILAGRTAGFVLGPYVLLEPIYRGTTGRFYLAKHKTMSRRVVVKVLDPEATADETACEAVLAEAKAAARVSHPNLASILDVNKVNERVYFVLEYIEGTTVAATVKQGGPMPVVAACRLMRLAAQGLAALHAKGLAHGGVNPGNLLIGGGEAGDPPPVKWLNAGQSRLRAVAGPDAEAATYATVPAESGSAGDLFGLGGLLYFLLTGQPPVPFHKHNVSRDPLPVEHVRPDVPRTVVALVKRLMAAEPRERPSAAEVVEVLEPFAEPAGGVAMVDFNAVPPPRPPRKTPVPASPPPNQSLVATLDAEVVVTPVQTPAPSRPRPLSKPQPVPVERKPAKPHAARKPAPSLPAYLPYAVAGGAIALTLAVIAVVLRAAMR